MSETPSLLDCRLVILAAMAAIEQDYPASEWALRLLYGDTEAARLDELLRAINFPGTNNPTE